VSNEGFYQRRILPGSGRNLRFYGPAVSRLHALDPSPARLIRDAGFEIVGMVTEYLKGPRPLTYTYSGEARSPAGRTSWKRS
jgi:hypothetical protein